jgi:hypothetical protein
MAEDRSRVFARTGRGNYLSPDGLGITDVATVFGEFHIFNVGSPGEEWCIRPSRLTGQSIRGTAAVDVLAAAGTCATTTGLVLCD